MSTHTTCHNLSICCKFTFQSLYEYRYSARMQQIIHKFHKCTSTATYRDNSSLIASDISYRNILSLKHIYKYVCMCVCMCVYVCMYVCVYVCIISRRSTLLRVIIRHIAEKSCLPLDWRSAHDRQVVQRGNRTQCDRV